MKTRYVLAVVDLKTVLNEGLTYIRKNSDDTNGLRLVVRDTIDNELYDIEDLNIDELRYYLSCFPNSKEFNVLQEVVNGRTELPLKDEVKCVYKASIPISINPLYEKFTSVPPDGIINTSTILTVIIIDINTPADLKCITINNKHKCVLNIRSTEQSKGIRLKIKNKLNKLVLATLEEKTEIIISEKDLAKIGKYEESFDLVITIDELNNNKALRDCNHRFNTLLVRCDKFDMSNLLNINVDGYILACNELYNIEKWFDQISKVLQEKRLKIYEKGSLLAWVHTLENFELSGNTTKPEYSNFVLELLELDGFETVDNIKLKQFQQNKGTLLKTYKNMVIELNYGSYRVYTRIFKIQ